MSNNPPEKCLKCGGTVFTKCGTYSNLKEERQVWICKTKRCGKTVTTLIYAHKTKVN